MQGPFRNLAVDLRLVVTGLAFLAAAAGGLALGGTGAGLASFWPANGVLAGLLLALPRERRAAGLGAAALGGLAAHLAYGGSLTLACVLTALDLAEAALAADLLERLAGRPFGLATLRRFAALAVTGLVVPALGATLAIGLLPSLIAVPPATTWLLRWSSSSIGMLLFAPTAALLAAWAWSGERRAPPLGQLAETGASLALLAAFVTFVCLTDYDNVSFLLPALLLWPALRGGVTAAAVGCAMLATAAAIGAELGTWPVPFQAMGAERLVGPASLEQRLLQQLGVVLIAVPALAAAVLRAREGRARRQLDDALAAMDDALALWSADGRLLVANPSWRRCFLEPHGLAAEGMTLRRLLSELHGHIPRASAQDPERWIAEREALIRAGGEDELVLADGRILHNVRRPTPDGGFVYVGRDVTASRRLEAEVAQARARLDRAVEAMQDSFALFDAEQRLVAWNGRFVRNFERVAERIAVGVTYTELVRELVRRGAYEGVPASEAERFAEGRAELMRKAPSEARSWLAGKGCFDIRMQPLGDGSVIMVARDITESALHERELARAKAQLEDAVANIDEGFALYDAQDRLVLANARLKELYPRSADLWVPGAAVADILRGAALRGEYKGVRRAEVETWLRTVLTEREDDRAYLFERADGRWIEATTRPTSAGGRITLYRDVTERRRQEQALRHAALHDPLTGLANRAGFEEELRRGRGRTLRDGTSMAVMLIDLDRFKEVNDLHGHLAGDALLVEVARRLRRQVREGDFVARLGGDEFAILAYDRSDAGGYQALARRVVGVLKAPLVVDGQKIRPGGSVGYVVFPDDRADGHDLVAAADRALYAAKEAGRGTWARLGGETGDPPAQKGHRLVEALAQALAQGQLDVDYQPIVGLETLEVTGVEAFVRWNHPRRGRLSAADFIAAAERGPGLLQLTRFVLGAALEAQRRWRDGGAGDPSVWINLAPRALASEDLVATIVAALAGSGVEAARLVLEVTEAALEKARIGDARLHALRKLGLELALDDFGAGPATLGHLDRLPLRYLKLDRGLTGPLGRGDPRSEILVRTIASLAAELGIVTVAEAIETREQMAVLRRLGVAAGQGYLFARPMPAAALEAWLRTWSERRRLGPDRDLLLHADPRA